MSSEVRLMLELNLDQLIENKLMRKTQLHISDWFVEKSVTDHPIHVDITLLVGKFTVK